MKVPFVNLKPLSQRLKSKVLEDWSEVLENTEFVGGPSVQKLELELAQRLEVPHVVTCANGTDALILALQALDVGPGDKVAVPNLTFWATYEAIIHRGAIPVLIDSNSDDLQMDFEEFCEAHKKYNLKAAFLVHLFGWASPYTEKFRNFCKENSISLIEDGAQAYGVRKDSHSIFKGSLMATMSFYPAKVIGGAMDGGAILCSSEDQAKLCRVLANHGRSSHYSYSHAGWNSRMGGLQAKWLLRFLEIENDIFQSRLKTLEFYQREIPSTDCFKWVKAPGGIETNAYLAVARVPESQREKIQNKALELGVDCKNTYPETLSMQPMCKNDLRISDLVNSNKFVREVLNLPLYAFMEKDELNFVATIMKKLINN